MKYILTTASVLALMTSAGTAQQVIELDELVISVSPSAVEAGRTGASVEVVTEEALEDAPGRTVSDVLNELPGVTVSGNGGLGASTSLRVRGLPSRYAPVYINGIDVTDPAAPQTQFDFGALTSGGISRVEVLKGSQSAIYGSEAIGGVVNIQSFRATEIGTQAFVQAEAGSFDTYALTFGVATKSERGEIALTLSQVETDGFSGADENNGNTEADGFSGTQLFLTGSYEATETVTLGFALNYLDSTVDIDGFPAPTFTLGDTIEQIDTTRTAARVYAQIDGGAIQHEIALSYSETERFQATGFTQLFIGEREEISYVGIADLRAVTLSFGAQYSEESYTADGVGGAYEIASIFAEVQYAVSAEADLSFALRHDDHSQYGGFTTGRLAFNYRLNDATTLRASAGTGFRAPSLFELFSSFGNPNLQPEESLSFDLGIEHRYDSGAFVRATAFYTEIDNLIGFAGSSYSQVPGTSTARGLEFSAAVPLSDMAELYASYTYTDTEDASGNQLRRVPEHDFVIGIEADFSDRLSGTLSLQHVAGRADDGFPAVAMGDNTVVNAAISYDFTDTATGYVRVENLLDEEYQTAAGYGTSDRAIYVGVRANF